ncbi:S-adenosyl-L-methionine-dependent methyltransferase [Apodospora peruviana]|uniref:S-adenosyl-L-methionine-dependent methyltransferase n=1 Tax=Apodospora peruviana TaxID=516989 RepID=A0AAE0MAS7_9PEZI|nr:S-adenosyl-L-methionine-dependent methyltransferase [Apodospora peruviana]
MTNPEELGRLQSTFLDKSLSAHPSTWDSLWKESYTPWDRGGPSLALNDLLLQHPDLFPSSERRPTALVPGCGRGHDVLLLSQLGYDAYGLDFSDRAIAEAKENERTDAEKEKIEGGWDEGVTERKEKGKGKVTWLVGDFFDEASLARETGLETFDLVFDYTFFCALPPTDGRPKWAKRVASLLTPTTGRLVCLEWPLHKPASTGGPPWGVTAEAYAAHLARPGEVLTYDEKSGNLISKTDCDNIAPGGLKRLVQIQPTRTHKIGYDPDTGNMIDFISVWGHP